MTWETFRKQRVNHDRGFASIFASGRLSIPESVAVALGSHARLLYDRETNRMALQPTDDHRLGYSVKKASRQNSWSISIIGFINHYGLDIRQKRYQISQEQDLFVIDLNDPV